MTNEIWAAILGALVGSFLSAGTGWFVAWKNEQRQIKRHRSLIKTAICDDLENSITISEKIEDEWDKGKIIWNSTVTEFRESRAIYERHKEQIIVFDNEKIRKSIMSYYSKSNQVINFMEFGQKRRLEIENYRTETFINIKRNNPSMPDNEINDMANRYLEREMYEYNFLMERLGKNIRKLAEVKSSAKGLLTDLNNL